MCECAEVKRYIVCLYMYARVLVCSGHSVASSAPDTLVFAASLATQTPSRSVTRLSSIMAPKRAVSAANVSAKRGKVGRHLDSLTESENRIEFQKDLGWVMDQLKSNPEKMQSVKAVLKMDKSERWDRAANLNPELNNKAIVRLPPRFLAFEFFVAMKTITRNEMTAIIRTDGRAPLKMLMRLCVVPPSCLIGPLQKSRWIDLWTNRMQCFGHGLALVSWDRDFNIDWMRSGLFALHPEQPEDTDSSKHIYKDIEFLGMRASLEGDVVVRGTWTVASNWSLYEAELVNPSRADMRLKCSSFFAPKLIEDRVPPMNALPESPLPALDDKKKVAIEDGAIDEDEASVKSHDTSDDAPPPSSAKSTSVASPCATPIAVTPPKPVQNNKVVTIPGARSSPTAPKAPPGKANIAAKFLSQVRSTKST